MTVEEVYKYYGTGYLFQRNTGFSHTNIINWRKSGYIPYCTQVKLERMTQGALKVRAEDCIPK